MRQAILLLLFSFVLACKNQASAAYYQTLPKGIRSVVINQVMTSKINSSFSGNQAEKDYFFNLPLDTDTLSSALAELDAYFKWLETHVPEAYQDFTLGEFEVDANARVNVTALAFAYGILDNVTSYVILPYYRGNVDIDFIRTKGNTNEKTKALVNSYATASGDPEASIYQGITNSLPDGDGGYIQSVLVNGFGYQPIGSWQATGLGDIELGTIIRLTDFTDRGLAITGGFVLPTGRTDDPNILQDIPFGDGQFDLFAEFGGGSRILDSNLSFDSFIRYTYQAPSSKTLRIPDSTEYPLGSKTATFKEKLGDKIGYAFGLTHQSTDWLSFTATYLYDFQFESEYTSEHTLANNILAQNTEKESHTLKGQVGISTVNLYKAGKFMIPFNISFSIQKIMTGRNVPNYGRADLQLRLFF